MSRKPRPAKPVESFGPELLQALLTGAKKEISFPLSWRQAIKFRLRANALRASMREHQHPNYTLVSQSKVTITIPEEAKVRTYNNGVRVPIDSSTICTVKIMPSDSEFAEVLKNAGVELPPLTAPETPGDDILSEFLKKDEVK